MFVAKSPPSAVGFKNGTGSTRREFIRNAFTITALAALMPLPGIAASLSSASDPVSGFITLSQTITERRHLDSTLAARFLAVFSQRDNQFIPRLNRLMQLWQPGDSAQQLMDKASAAGLQSFLYQIVTAWYTGTVGDDYHGTLVAYKQALMYQPVSDGLIVPTYCGNGPIWWTAPLPAESSTLPEPL